MFNILEKLKTKDKYETLENYSLLVIFASGVIMSLGIALTAISTTGLPAIMSMLGGLVAFLGTVLLIFIWLIKEFRSE